MDGLGFRIARAARLATGIACLFAAGFSPDSALAQDAVRGFTLLVLEGKPVKWAAQAPGAPAVVRYSFVDEPLIREHARNCRNMEPFPASMAAGSISFDNIAGEFRTAFDRWHQIAGIEFVEVEADSDASLLLGVQSRARGIAYADVVAESNDDAAFGNIREAVICLNPNLIWNFGFDGNISTRDVRYVALHEIGHAIGLDHVRGRRPTVMNFRYTETFSGLQPGDIAGARLLYGPSQPVRTEFVTRPATETLTPVSAEISR